MKRGVLATLAVMVSLAGAGAAGHVWSQDTGGQRGMASSYLKEGSLADLERRRFYPGEAFDRSVSGRALIRCKIARSRLTACEAETEKPAGMGFGPALARSVEGARLNKSELAGRAEGDIVRVYRTMESIKASERPSISRAVWREAPTFDQIDAAGLAATGEPGSAALRCTVVSDGSLKDCIVAGQVPRNSRFGAVAMTLVPAFRAALRPDEMEEMSPRDVLISFQFRDPSAPEGRSRRIERPDWIDAPNQDQIMESFPREAREAGIAEGVGLVTCQVGNLGALFDCAASEEKPQGLGFGRSAVAVANKMRLSLWTSEGRPVLGGEVMFAVRFSPTAESEPVVVRATPSHDK